MDWFPQVARSARGHFRLTFYAAVFRLIHQVNRLAQSGGDSLEQIFRQFPFLRRYFEEMRQHMPPDVTWKDSLHWWQEAVADWEAGCDVHLPLRALAEQAGISFAGQIALLTVGLVEEDSRFGTLFAALQQPLAQRRPSLELVGRLTADPGAGEDAWSVCRPLVAVGLVDVANREAPRSEWELCVPPALWDIIRGDEQVSGPGWLQHHLSGTLTAMDGLILPAVLRDQLAQLPDLIRGGRTRAVILRGMRGSEGLEAAGAVARAMGWSALEVEGAALQSERHGQQLGLLCTMTRSLPVVRYDLGPGETAQLPELAGYQGPVAILLGMEGGVRGKLAETAVTLTLPAPTRPLRRRYWEQALGQVPAPDLDEIAARFLMPAGYIRQAAAIAAARAALHRRGHVVFDDAREATRALNRQTLDSLAARLDPQGDWDRLVVSAGTRVKLEELERRCRHRESLLEHLGPGFDSGNWGVRALFKGPSGTGKTLAARILASVLGMDLYRVDLAAVVNKYIGETEKNLNQVLSRAEELDVILLLDEGDALMAKRSDVKSANDRYANLETNYLLQRLERYQGIVVVTTNAGEQIDQAFQRRMDVVVNFLSPQAQERLHIWHLHLPPGHGITPAYLEEVAVRCALTGGQIRNAVLHATLSALDRGGVIDSAILDDGIQSEYRKAGAISPLYEVRPLRVQEGGVKDFLDGIVRNGT